MSHPVFEQVRQNDGTVHRMLREGRPLEEIIAVLAMEKQALTIEITMLKLQQPITYVVPNDLADTWKGMTKEPSPLPPLPPGLPPLPPGTRYAGQLKDHEGEIVGWIFCPEDPRGWEHSHPITWGGMKQDPTGSGAHWHLAVPI